MPAPNSSSKAFTGVLVAELHFPESGSLKGKRAHMRRIKDQVTRRFGASVAEVGFQDLWQRTRVLIVYASSDVQVLEETMQRTVEYLDGQEWVLSFYRTEVVDVYA